MNRRSGDRVACLALVHAGRVVELERRTLWQASGAEPDAPILLPPYALPLYDVQQEQAHDAALRTAESARNCLAMQRPVCFDGALCQLLAMFRDVRFDATSAERLAQLANRACSFLTDWAYAQGADKNPDDAVFAEWLVRRLLGDPAVRTDDKSLERMGALAEALEAHNRCSELDPRAGIQRFEKSMVKDAARNLSRHARIAGWQLAAADPHAGPSGPDRPFVISAAAPQG